MCIRDRGEEKRTEQHGGRVPQITNTVLLNLRGNGCTTAASSPTARKSTTTFRINTDTLGMRAEVGGVGGGGGCQHSISDWATPATHADVTGGRPVRLSHTPSIAFRHLPPNSARFNYATEVALFISAQLSTDAVSALRKLSLIHI